MNLDHHEVRRGEAKASNSRLHSKQIAPSPTPVQGQPSVTFAAADPTSTQSLGRKRSKADGTKLSDPISKEVGTVSQPLKRQYLTRSKAAAIPRIGMKPNTPTVVFQSLHSSDDSAPSSTF
ncbi:hypothetical protein NC653_008291 [Populus alba x Populus x berolinensis]|uniref:Uncharacterized protein n=1 Tax=Populus alba x Populus x berolinensis TaxID=444605 RepID=A0AAD6R630_9ROSI|nr:hypothetical protein NC653_008291 [Populus alba x Populus x berolinensis]